ncbi:hypothetical protein [Paraflavitalea sp. CAU 1676]|uniref:hypothetical protein n=1 Tax=Paraflavitalea sp. CAU 1676 TaxID=3032598 RepID=UPI0023DCA9CE|nr:hypothetical protein [Paraflavitalea sp. CAU 1676]MDF2192810.1 hypothetical protein [Paraflavitalea sp. CAU 1676]
MKTSLLLCGNLLCFPLLIIIYYLTAYGLGYATSAGHENEASILLAGFMGIQLAINVLTLYLFKVREKLPIIASNSLILILYGTMYWVWR